MEFDRRIKFPRLSPKLLASRRTMDFTTGSCTVGDGVKIAQDAISVESSKRAIRARRAARKMCETCPLLTECRTWVTEMEDPPGSWGGVWGGLDPWNRRGLELIIVGQKTAVVPYVS